MLDAVSLAPGAVVEVGRPVWSDPTVLTTQAWSEDVHDAVAGLAWGVLPDDAVSRWVAAVRPGGVLAWVIAVTRPGLRGALDRLALLPSRHAPTSLEDVCTGLFVQGVGSLRVFPLEPHRSLVAVVGVRRAT